MAVLAGACSTSGGEIVTKPDDVATGVAGSQSVPLAGRAGASGTAGTGGAAGGGGVAPSTGGFAGQASGAGGSPLTCPPDGAKVPDCTDASAQSCAGCVCGAPDGCLDAWTACRADVGCARGLGCILAGCASQTCAVIAGQGHAMLVSVVACFGGECSTRCTGEVGTGGAGGSSGAAGKAGSGGKAGAAGAAANGGAGGGPPPSGMAGAGGSGG